jgi:structural maintenance of chromosome 1
MIGTTEIDFAKLDSKYRTMTAEEIEKEAEEVSSSIETETKSIETIVAQGKCTFQSEKLKEIENKIKEANQQLEYMDSLSKDARAKFVQVKEKRRALFMHTFDLVAKNIEKIYKDMTKSEKNTYYGGNALLYAEVIDEPYNGGIVYSPTPPGKRCMYEMDQLSGGEKTIAALSLLFAIHSAMPSPFYFMDEVDAFLDWENCQLLLGYLQKVAEEQSQCIIITHKEEFFTNADSLIGTTFVPSEFTSKSFSLDLRQYGPKQIALV